MKIFKIISFSSFLLFISKIILNNCSSSIIKQIDTEINKRKLTDSLCNIKNCITCDNRNECIKCKEGFQLDNKRCYTKSCEIYGFCKYCDEYDCLKCLKGYKLNYGICDTKETSKKKFYFGVILTIILIAIIIYLYNRYKKIALMKIKTGQIIKFMHPKSGFYQLNYENNNEVDISTNKVFISNNNNNENEGGKESPVVNRCVVCENENKNTYTIADCGCSICFEHYKMIKLNKNIKCPIHKVELTSTISFKMEMKSKIKGNALEKLGLPKCPICKINDGTQSFNCGCAMRVCEKCFNDNVYVFKYNQCPGCGMPYHPIKFTKRKNKSSEEKIGK
jgi:hypothetical protein